MLENFKQIIGNFLVIFFVFYILTSIKSKSFNAFTWKDETSSYFSGISLFLFLLIYIIVVIRNLFYDS